MKYTLLLAASAVLAACATTPAPAPEAPATEDADAGRTAPLPVIPMISAPLDREATLTRIGFGSCLKQEDDQSIWNTIAASNPDVFLFIGDNVYGDVWSKDADLPELRQAYRTLARSEPFAKLRQSTPVLPVWDDHDYGMNDAGGTYEYKYGTEALFEEAWGLTANDPRRMRDGVYHSEIIGMPGQRVQIILLDTRFFRSDLKPTDERNAVGKERWLPDADPSKTMLGDSQYEWLAEELRKPAELRLIVSSIQVISQGHGWEAWGTLPEDRQKFYDFISASGAENVVILSGDRHSGSLYRKDGVLPYPLYEITSSSLNAPASVWRAQSGETRVEEDPNRLGDMEFDINFGMIEVDWDAKQFTMELLDAEGTPMQSKTLKFNELVYRD